MSAMPSKASVTHSPRADRIRHPEVDSFDLATIMRALGDPVRIEMVRQVDADGEILCSDLYDRLGLPGSTGSYHLRRGPREPLPRPRRRDLARRRLIREVVPRPEFRRPARWRRQHAAG